MKFNETKDEVIMAVNPSEATVEQWLFGINQALKDDNWIQETPYTSDTLTTDIATFNMADFPKSLHKLIDFMWQIKKNVSSPGTEFFHWNKKGLYCVYMSVLTKIMYERIDKENAEKLHYYQGIYKTLNGNYTLHAWLNFEGQIIDITAQGQYDTLMGCKESKETVEKYLNKFANESRISKEELLGHYFNQFINF